MSQRKHDETIWEDCGCPLSRATGSFTPDVAAITSLPHMCTIGSDEAAKHYTFGRTAFEKATKSPSGSPRDLWVQKRCQENRLFVAKPPSRPTPPPVPWRYDEPPLEWDIPPGWRTWEPKNPKLNFSEANPVAAYDANLGSFFLYMHIKDLVQQNQMRESVEKPSRNDRCFVTSSGELLECLIAAGNKLNHYLKDLGIKGRARHLRRLVDIRMDAKVKIGGCGHMFNP